MFFVDDRSLAERFRDWDWDLAPIWAWISDTVSFHYQEYGWIALLVAISLAIALLLMFDMTSYITELVLASAVRAVFGGVTLAILGAMTFFGITTGRMAIAKFRNALGISGEALGQKKDHR